MLATLNAKQIVDEIVKDAGSANDPHDAIQIAPDVVLASRAEPTGPTLVGAVDLPREPRFGPVIDAVPAPNVVREPNFNSVGAPPPAPDIGNAIRGPTMDDRLAQKPSDNGKWLRRALVTILCIGACAAATVAWDRHGETARQMLADWTPAVAALIPARTQAAQVTDTPGRSPATSDQTSEPSGAPQLAAQPAANAPASSAETTASMQAMTRDLAAMAQQIEQLKTSLAELKAGQEQMAREMAKSNVPKPLADARPAVDAHARLAMPARPPARKPKPAVTRTYTPPTYSPVPAASQAAALPPPPPPVATSQAVADDDGPVVRPPMPLR